MIPQFLVSRTAKVLAAIFLGGALTVPVVYRVAVAYRFEPMSGSTREATLVWDRWESRPCWMSWTMPGAIICSSEDIQTYTDLHQAGFSKEEIRNHFLKQ
jgi:hypothetical protein